MEARLAQKHGFTQSSELSVDVQRVYGEMADHFGVELSKLVDRVEVASGAVKRDPSLSPQGKLDKLSMLRKESALELERLGARWDNRIEADLRPVPSLPAVDAASAEEIRRYLLQQDAKTLQSTIAGADHVTLAAIARAPGILKTRLVPNAETATALEEATFRVLRELYPEDFEQHDRTTGLLASFRGDVQKARGLINKVTSLG